MNDELDQPLPSLGKELERWIITVAQLPHLKNILATGIQHSRPVGKTAPAHNEDTVYRHMILKVYFMFPSLPDLD